jgi:hypothetical protein
MKDTFHVYFGIASMALLSAGCGLQVASTSIPITSKPVNNSAPATGGGSSNVPIPTPTTTGTLTTCIPGANVVSPQNGAGAGCYQVQRSTSDPNLINISAITAISETVCVIPVIMLTGIPVPISSTFQNGVEQSETTCLRITTATTQLQFTSNYYSGPTRVPLNALIIVTQSNWNALNYDLTTRSPYTHALPTATTFSFGNVN